MKGRTFEELDQEAQNRFYHKPPPQDKAEKKLSGTLAPLPGSPGALMLQLKSYDNSDYMELDKAAQGRFKEGLMRIKPHDDETKDYIDEQLRLLNADDALGVVSSGR